MKHQTDDGRLRKYSLLGDPAVMTYYPAPKTWAEAMAGCSERGGRGVELVPVPSPPTLEPRPPEFTHIGLHNGLSQLKEGGEGTA